MQKLGKLWDGAKALCGKVADKATAAVLAVGSALGLVAQSEPASATSVFDPLTTAVSFTDVSTALFTVAATLMGVYVIIKGIAWVIAMVRRR